MKHTYDLAAWLNFFGIKGGQVPDIVPVIQPTLDIGQNENVFPLLAPTQNAGGLVSGGAGQVATMAIEAKTKGGAFVDYVSVTTTAYAPVSFRWKITTTNPGLAAHTANIVFGDPESAITSGSAAAPGAPFLFAQGDVTAFRPLYIPPGSFGVVASQVTAGSNLFGLRVRDVPAMQGGA